MSFPKVVILLLAGSIVYSYAGEREPGNNTLGDVVQVLQQKRENPEAFKTISFIVQLSADLGCTIGTLQPIVAPLFAFIEQEQRGDQNGLALLAALGSPCKELLMGAGDPANIHGRGDLSFAFAEKKLIATFNIVVQRATVCDEQAWAVIVQGCIDFLARCSQAITVNEMRWLEVVGGPLQQVLTTAVQTPGLHTKMKMEFVSQHDDTLYAEFVHD